MSFEGEKVYQSKKPIKYVLQSSATKCDFLVVVFSAFNPRGSAPAYNYIRTLQSLDVNKLFILDDQGERGSYYLGNNRNFDVESSVASLIKTVANEKGVPHSNIFCCGSSKGGYAALYFGIKYGFGHVIAGAPQTKLGHYLYYAKEHLTFEFIAGDLSNDSMNFLDSLLYDTVSNVEKVPDILIHVGSGDHHYKGHVLPFMDHLKSHGFECSLDTREYSDHGDVRYFQKILVERLIESVPNLKNAIRIIDTKVRITGRRINVETITNKQASYAWYVFKNGERIKVEWYKENHVFEYVVTEPGVYHFEAFAKDEEGRLVSEKTKELTFY